MKKLLAVVAIAVALSGCAVNVIVVNDSNMEITK